VSVKDEPSIEDEDSLEEEYDLELFSPDSHWLCTNGSGHTPRLWDLTDANPGRAFGELPDGHTAPIHAVAFSPDGHWLVTGSSDATARLWDLQNRTAKPTVFRPDFVVGAVGISSDSRWLFAIGSKARLWDLTLKDKTENSIALPVEGSLGYSSYPAFSRDGPDSRWLLTVNSNNKTVSLWNMRLDEL